MRLQDVTLRDFRTVDAANILSDLYRSNRHGRTMLKHCKSILSGIFTLARNQGVLDKTNPVQGTVIPKKAAPPRETHAATPDEVMAILDAIETAKPKDKSGEEITISRGNQLKAQAAVVLQFFAGLRPGEARGVCWEDFDGSA